MVAAVMVVLVVERLTEAQGRALEHLDQDMTVVLAPTLVLITQAAAAVVPEPMGNL